MTSRDAAERAIVRAVELLGAMVEAHAGEDSARGSALALTLAIGALSRGDWSRATWCATAAETIAIGERVEVAP